MVAAVENSGVMVVTGRLVVILSLVAAAIVPKGGKVVAVMTGVIAGVGDGVVNVVSLFVVAVVDDDATVGVNSV